MEVLIAANELKSKDRQAILWPVARKIPATLLEVANDSLSAIA
jgi:hypothetical protein